MSLYSIYGICNITLYPYNYRLLILTSVRTNRDWRNEDLYVTMLNNICSKWHAQICLQWLKLFWKFGNKANCYVRTYIYQNEDCTMGDDDCCRRWRMSTKRCRQSLVTRTHARPALTSNRPRDVWRWRTASTRNSTGIRSRLNTRYVGCVLGAVGAPSLRPSLRPSLPPSPPPPPVRDDINSTCKFFLSMYTFITDNAFICVA